MDESICKKCGKCCYYKILINGKIHDTKIACKYLDTKTNLCKIYKNRHLLNPTCISMEIAIKMGHLPEDCGYIQNQNTLGVWLKNLEKNICHSR